MVGIDHGINARLEFGFVVFHPWLVEWVYASEIAADGTGFLEEIDDFAKGESRKFADVEQNVRGFVFLMGRADAVTDDVIEAVQTGAAAGNAWWDFDFIFDVFHKEHRFDKILTSFL